MINHQVEEESFVIADHQVEEENIFLSSSGGLMQDKVPDSGSYNRSHNHPNENTQKNTVIWFIRHGESEAHISKVAIHAEEIRLTKTGKRQAEEIIRDFPYPPDRVISSPYLRAWETAAPTLHRFPGIPHDIWPIQEFTYLGSLAGVSSTKNERHCLVDEYWRRCDPIYQDENGESFAQFIQRVRATIWHLNHLNGFVVIFTHEQFIRAAQGLLEGWLGETPKAMVHFREILLTQPLDYCSTLRLYIGNDTLRLRLRNGQERLSHTEHIPRSRLTVPTPR